MTTARRSLSGFVQVGPGRLSIALQQVADPGPRPGRGTVLVTDRAMLLRPARDGDVPALIGLARRSWRSGFSAAPPEFVREWLAREFEPESYPKYWPTMTVADGVLLGLVQPMKDEVNGLWVDPAAQGHGVGTALLRRAEAEIAAAGYRRVWLTCSGLTRTGYGSMRPAGTAGPPLRLGGVPAGSSRRLRFSSATCSRQ